ncbi:hypothetical protein OCH239_15600 [Roseivivax halodurans JCM 10272]|uniref:Uncharacterized protein n=1 Tax=Roseivivax halodurans JCM 10272 TaxID=1449350 RepID=X7ECK7_9RHOB|nr:hypothetical protein OCH239_15600 [Roseivivax halodurans JCM 10272]
MTLVAGATLFEAVLLAARSSCGVWLLGGPLSEADWGLTQSWCISWLLERRPELDIGLAIHLSFEGLQTIDLPLRLKIVGLPTAGSNILSVNET